jgi:hypothetical protein
VETIIGIAFLVAIFLVPVRCVRWVLGPLDRAATSRRAPLQFGLADLFCLFVLVQLLLGGLAFATRGVTIRKIEIYDEFFLLYVQKMVPVLDVVVLLITTMTWWTYVRMLSRAGVHIVWHRCATLIVALPVALLGSIAIIALPLVALAMFANHNPIGFGVLLMEALLVGVFYGLSRFTHAIVAGAQAGRNNRRECAEAPQPAGCYIAAPHRPNPLFACILYRLGRFTRAAIVAAKARRYRRSPSLDSHVLGEDSPRHRDVVSARDDRAGVREDG